MRTYCRKSAVPRPPIAAAPAAQQLNRKTYRHRLALAVMEELSALVIALPINKRHRNDGGKDHSGQNVGPPDKCEPNI
jgi:hypothetical protein